MISACPSRFTPGSNLLQTNEIAACFLSPSTFVTDGPDTKDSIERFALLNPYLSVLRRFGGASSERLENSLFLSEVYHFATSAPQATAPALAFSRGLLGDSSRRSSKPRPNRFAEPGLGFDESRGQRVPEPHAYLRFYAARFVAVDYVLQSGEHRRFQCFHRECGDRGIEIIDVHE